MRSNVAVMIPSGRATDEVLKHEYVHFLVRNRDSRAYPTWFDEGFAEVLTTCSVKGDVLEYGNVPPGRAEWLNGATWTSYEKILPVRETGSLGPERRAMFYAQSWLLMHYLMLGRRDADFRQEAARFLQLSETGRLPAEAFEEAFGIPPSRLRMTLKRYTRKLRYRRGKLKQPVPPVQTTTRRMGQDEIASELGWLVMDAAGCEASRRYFEAALAVNPENGNALVGLGEAHRSARRFEEARPFYEKAIALHPDEANHELDFAKYFLSLAKAQKDPADVRASLIEARRHFARSYELKPTNPETLAMNGSSYLFAGDDLEKGLESLERAHQLLPSQPTIRFLLAQAYIANGRRGEARPHVQRLLAWSNSAMVDELADLLRETEEAEGQAPSAEPAAEKE